MSRIAVAISQDDTGINAYVDYLLLGGRPKSRQSVKSRCNAAFPHGDARTGESHSTCPKVTAQVANPHVDARFDMASQQKENCSIRWK